MSRIMKWTKRIAIGLAVLVGLALIVVAFMSWQAGRKVAARIETIRAAGDPVTFTDLIPPPLDPADNAATYLQRAYDDAIAMGKEFRPLWDNEERYYANEQLNDEGADRVRDTLDAYPNVIPLLMKASNIDNYVSPVDLTGDFSDVLNSAIDQAPKIRNASRVLTRHAELLIHDGQHDEATDSCLAIMRLARLGDTEPFLVGNLVAIAVRGIGCDTIAKTLRAGSISNASRQKIEQELARHDGMPGHAYALRSERVLFINGFREVVPPLVRHLPQFVNDEFDGLGIFDAYIRIAGKPRYQVSQELAAVEKQASSAGVLTRLSAPALRAAREAVDRSRATLRCTRVLVALHGHLEENPSVPPALEKLDVPAEAKIDPYTGDPLKLKKTDNGWIVYSVGADLVDQEGSIEDMKDVGVGPVGGE